MPRVVMYGKYGLWPEKKILDPKSEYKINLHFKCHAFPIMCLKLCK